MIYLNIIAYILAILFLLLLIYSTIGKPKVKWQKLYREIQDPTKKMAEKKDQKAADKGMKPFVFNYEGPVHFYAINKINAIKKFKLFIKENDKKREEVYLKSVRKIENINEIR